MLPVAILAGGLATRLCPITEKIPKAFIEVAQRPFIDHQLQYLREQGVDSVVLCVGYFGEMIREFVGNGSRWGLRVNYSFDGPKLLGTGGALKQALPLLGREFFILYGDSYLPVNFTDVRDEFIKVGHPGLMTVLKNNNLWDKSNVEYENGKILEYNKQKITPNMHYIDYGLSILRADILGGYPQNTAFDLSEVYNQLSLKNMLAGYEVFERFYEIGSQQGILDAEIYLSKMKDTKGIT